MKTEGLVLVPKTKRDVMDLLFTNIICKMSHEMT